MNLASRMDQPKAILLSLQGISKTFDTSSHTVAALHEVSLDIKSGEFVCIVGPSGCGKTTLLNIVAGLEEPDHGIVAKNNITISGPGRDRLVMFQDSALFPWLTVLGNVLFGLKLIPELSKKERVDRALQFLTMVGLEKFKNSYIHELSGGMRQRVALARALAPNPEVLLMDEPFASLDAMSREWLYADLQHICSEQKKTVLLVTHNIREAVCLGDRVLLFSPSPGQIASEHYIGLPRPRDINSVELAKHTSEITRELKSVMKGSHVR